MGQRTTQQNSPIHSAVNGHMYQHPGQANRGFHISHQGPHGQEALLQQGVYLPNIPNHTAAIPLMGPRLNQGMGQMPEMMPQGAGAQAA